jgi:hypothetical protein
MQVRILSTKFYIVALVCLWAEQVNNCSGTESLSAGVRSKSWKGMVFMLRTGFFQQVPESGSVFNLSLLCALRILVFK